MPAAIRRHYADPENLSVPDYLRYGQAFQALIHGNAMEALRFRKGDAADDCQGALIWSYSDCWGETGWSILDYYLRRKASYYAFRRACRPVKIIVRQRGEMLVTRVVNDTREAISTTAEVGWWRMDGTAREVRTLPVAVAANGAYTLDTAPLAPARDPREWLFAAVLREDGAPVDQSLLTFAPYRELAGVNAPLVVTAQADGLRVACAAYRHAVHVDDHGRALLSDNWFDLLPGVPVCLRPAEGAAVGAVDFADIGGYLRCGAL